VSVPALKNPHQVSAGGYHTCAIDDEGVKCWGHNVFVGTNVPALKNPHQLSAGFSQTCAIDDEGLKCWGYNGPGQQMNVSDLKNLR